jgi:hypothetical protein
MLLACHNDESQPDMRCRYVYEVTSREKLLLTIALLYEILVKRMHLLVSVWTGADFS